MGLIDGILKKIGRQDEENRPAGLGRNELCWCGSGKKYKKCHLDEDLQKIRSQCSVNCVKT